MPFSTVFDRAIMYPTKLLITSFRTYLLSVYHFIHTSLSFGDTGANKADPNPYPHGAYIFSEGDRRKQNKK